MADRAKLERELKRLTEKRESLEKAVAHLGDDTPAATLDDLETQLSGCRARIAEVEKELTAIVAAEEGQRLQEEEDQEDAALARYNRASSEAGGLDRLYRTSPALFRKAVAAREKENLRRLLGQ